MEQERHIIRRVDGRRWQEAQKAEADSHVPVALNRDDDWNQWWFSRFEEYELLANRNFNNVLEVGCGPCTNLWHILPRITYRRVFFEDPLIQMFFGRRTDKNDTLTTLLADIARLMIRKKHRRCHLLEMYSDPAIKIDLSSAPLEELPYADEMMDLVVCINVLDHVRDYDLCMKEMNRVLAKGGILVLGVDLSNEEDWRNSPESFADAYHPIKVDHNTIDESLTGYDVVLRRILSREEGRNPLAHYGTYLGIHVKR